MTERRILIVDDEASIRFVLRRTLESHGYTVIEATDGKEGIAALREGEIDLVITDIFMPNEDGLGLLRFMRAEKLETKAIVISAPASSASLDLAERLGAARVFSKPVQMGDLLAAVESLL